MQENFFRRFHIVFHIILHIFHIFPSARPRILPHLHIFYFQIPFFSCFQHSFPLFPQISTHPPVEIPAFFHLFSTTLHSIFHRCNQVFHRLFHIFHFRHVENHGNRIFARPDTLANPPKDHAFGGFLERKPEIIKKKDQKSRKPLHNRSSRLQLDHPRSCHID